MEINEVENILEGVSKQQKEAGQRAMNIEYSKISYRLDEYFNKKWQNKKTKEDYINAIKEKKRLQFVKKLLKLGPILSSKKAKSYVKETLGYEPEIKTRHPLFGIENSFSQRFKKVVLTNSKTKNGKYFVPVGSNSSKLYSDEELEELYKIWNKMNALHEYTHVFDYLKKYIETGKGSLGIKGTYELTDKVKDVEGSAMAGETDLLYRKDRREVLKQKNYSHPGLRFSYGRGEEEDYKKLMNKEDPNRSRYTDSLYLKGRHEKSKTLSPTMKSINVENVYKELSPQFEREKKWFIEELKWYNKCYNKNITMPNVRFGVLPHDKAKAPIYNEHNKIYIDVYAYEDINEGTFFIQLKNILFAKYPDLVKNDQTFRKFFAHNFRNKTHKKFDGYKKIIKGLENKDIYEDYFPY